MNQQRSSIRKIALWCAFSIFFCSIGFNLAEAYSDPDKTSGITAVTSPTNPKALDQVKITLTSKLYYLDVSTISWTLNGELKQRDVGAKTFTFNMGPTGNKTHIEAVIETQDGATIEKKISLEAGDVSLVWQADTYTPPTYLGKALASPKSKTTVMAFANFLDAAGNQIPSKDLVYTWKQNGNVLPNASGLGRQSLSYVTNPYNLKTIIGIEIKNPKTNTVIDREITIETKQPRIVFYEERPLSGTDYSRAVKDIFEVTSPMVSLRAEPFFFNQTDISRDLLSYSWSVDNNAIGSGNNNVINLQAPE
ncbi:MAG TPA: hypothetical protein VEB60_01140, partial [Candidatus Paceibacterota bacterium]|nr:hypothetical protein [Candidatus Paceibacterota bacterium]